MLPLIGAWIAGIVSPGPDLFQIIRMGTKSRAAGVACALGIMVGNTVWIVASLVGLSALMQARPEILAALQIIGGAYLLWMGIGAIRSTGGAAPRATADATVARALRAGILTNLSNPKAVLFFGAIFAQFVRPDMGSAAMLAIAVTLIAIGLAWFIGFALAVRQLAAPIERYGFVIDRVTGAIFVAIALWMLLEGLCAVAR
ncbi:LysE family translocator [Corynebacterium liangguodongii]|uniref:Threonine transporter n=1 Tax=Corynebacterium liangguodongii TaxID=2079535 RepID=A0A2S0WBJ9_9CORY|nr:LysE family transporter [Corynebacterium liangguodongii]AWB83146.1 threonine transporter [Corynebacterium liangguodongii]PWB98740.1 threonine transporter [Corynebacterium liangguodongii]